MIGQLPAQPIDAEVYGDPPCERHLFVAVVPLEQNVSPIEKRNIAARGPLLIGHRPQVGAVRV